MLIFDRKLRMRLASFHAKPVRLRPVERFLETLTTALPDIKPKTSGIAGEAASERFVMRLERCDAFARVCFFLNGDRQRVAIPLEQTDLATLAAVTESFAAANGAVYHTIDVVLRSGSVSESVRPRQTTECYLPMAAAVPVTACPFEPDTQQLNLLHQTEQTVLAAIARRLTTASLDMSLLAFDTQLERRSIHTAIASLIQKGQLVRVGRRTYQPPPSVAEVAPELPRVSKPKQRGGVWRTVNQLAGALNRSPGWVKRRIALRGWKPTEIRNAGNVRQACYNNAVFQLLQEMDS